MNGEAGCVVAVLLLGLGEAVGAEVGGTPYSLHGGSLFGSDSGVSGKEPEDRRGRALPEVPHLDWLIWGSLWWRPNEKPRPRRRRRGLLEGGGENENCPPQTRHVRLRRAPPRRGRAGLGGCVGVGKGRLW